MAGKAKTESKAAQRAERLAELKKQAKAQERRRNLMVGGVVGVVLVLIGVVFYVVSRSNDVDATGAGESKYGVTIGPDDAKHEIVIYEDFLCPFCRQLEAATRDQLAELAEAGKVRVDYRPFNLLGDYSARATSAFGVVLDEAGPTVAKKFHDLLYDAQPREDAATFPDADWFIDRAVEAGAAEDDVAEGIKAGENDFARGATAEARDAGVQSTPTVIVDGESFGSNDPKALIDAVDD